MAHQEVRSSVILVSQVDWGLLQSSNAGSKRTWFVSAFPSICAMCQWLDGKGKWRLFSYEAVMSTSGSCASVHQFAAHQLCWLSNIPNHRALSADIVQAEFGPGCNRWSLQIIVHTAWQFRSWHCAYRSLLENATYPMAQPYKWCKVHTCQENIKIFLVCDFSVIYA